MDLHATFLKMAGAEAQTPANKPLDGIDLLPLLTGNAKPLDRTFYWRIDRSSRKQKAIRHGKWKYVNDGNTLDLLFNLEANISEHTNLGYKHSDVLTDLKARLRVWEAEMDASDREIWVK